jgi:hypothetical protein
MRLRIINRETLKVQFQLEPRDLWVGLFWMTLHQMPPPCYTFHLYICFVPMVPLHITILLKHRAKTK